MLPCSSTTDSASITQGLRLLFAGTPEFSAIHLQALLDSRHTVLAVYTQPDRPAGRGRRLKASPVKQLALQYQLPVVQPLSLKPVVQQQEMADVDADLVVVVAYGLLLPQSVLDIPPLGCINVHPSSLPRWRGSAPIQRAILAGDTHTGVCIMQMDSSLDTGSILLHRQLTITNTDTAGSLHKKLAQLGATMLVDSLDQLQAGRLHSAPQSKHGVCYAAKLLKTEGAIDWHQGAAQIDRQVRGLDPWPVSYSDLQGQRLRIWSARPVVGSVQQPPGTLLQLNDQGLLVACGQGCLMINQLQWPGNKIEIASQLINLKQRLPLGSCFTQLSECSS